MYPGHGAQDSPRCTAEAGTTASCARAPRTSSCLGRNGSPRTQFAHRPGNDGSGFGVGALRPPVPGCSTTLEASATPRAVGRWLVRSDRPAKPGLRVSWPQAHCTSDGGRASTSTLREGQPFSVCPEQRATPSRPPACWKEGLSGPSSNIPIEGSWKRLQICSITSGSFQLIPVVTHTSHSLTDLPPDSRGKRHTLRSLPSLSSKPFKP